MPGTPRATCFSTINDQPIEHNSLGHSLRCSCLCIGRSSGPAQKNAPIPNPEEYQQQQVKLLRG